MALPNTLLVKSYATNVYLLGKNSLTNIAILRPEYVEPVKQYASDNYYIDEIDNALKRVWITEQEHADTIALKGVDDPQYMPPITSMAVEQQA